MDPDRRNQGGRAASHGGGDERARGGPASGLLTVIADWEVGAVLVHANAGATIAGRPVGSQDRDDSVQTSLAWGTTSASPDVTFLAGITLAFFGGEDGGWTPAR